MPEVEITVLNVPTECANYEDLSLALQTKKGDVAGVRTPQNSFVFRVPFELRNGKPSGATVNSQGDGRRFIYLRWMATQHGIKVQYGRIKVYFDQIGNIVESQEFYSVTINGLDTKGRPACATARIVQAE